MAKSVRRRRALRHLSFAVTAMACTSCSSASTTGSAAGSLTGSVGGVSLDVQDAFFVNNNPGTTGTVVNLTSYPGACRETYIGGHFPSKSVAMGFQLAAPGDGGLGPVAAPGKPVLAGAYWDSVDASCQIATTNATGGTVTITAVSASQLTGSFDLMFGNDHVTGSFVASNCPAALSHQGNPSCP
jgi:hypothetical protein